MAKDLPWTQEEIHASVKAYLLMLSKEDRGEKFVKTKINQEFLDKELRGRTKSALEFRHQNISAVLSTLGETPLKGYLPAKNVGKKVREMIVKALDDQGFSDVASGYSASPYEGGPVFPSYDASTATTHHPTQETPLPRGNATPETEQSFLNRVKRDLKVKAWILYNANGICEGCDQKGPFLNKGGIPHLEVHHVIFLSEGGPDTIHNTVALCPNCHAKCHYAKDRQSFAEELTVRVLSQRPQE